MWLLASLQIQWRAFTLEIQFRHFYVDYLLSAIGDHKRFFSECRCIRKGYPDSFADNVIMFNRKYLPVEVKLLLAKEPHIKRQVWKYTHDDKIMLDENTGRSVVPEKVYSDHVLIIDTEKIYIYEESRDTVTELYDLDSLHTLEDLEDIRHLISSKLPG